MKRIFGILASILLLVMSVSSFTACSPTLEENDYIDEDKTQLYVGQEANGYGTRWCDETVKAFEAWAAEKSYEPGKKGVQVRVSTRGFAGTAFLTDIKDSPANVIFSEECYYYDYVSKGVLMDLTEAVTTPLTEFGETETIEQKMVADNGNQLKNALTGPDGKYYALPWWSGLQGLSYDVDLFDEKNFYIAKGGAPSEYERAGENVDAALSGSFGGTYKWTGLSGERAAGPDGKYGTYDDGLPATYEEFYRLCQRMQQRSVTPIIWTGQYKYGDMFVKEMMSDFQMSDSVRMSYDFKGTAYDLIESYETNPDGSVKFDTIKYMGGGDGTPSGGGTGVEITEKNAYLLSKQAGKLYALSFAETLVDKGYLSSKCFSQDLSHTATQEYFLRCKYESDFETCGILSEGTWWMGQAENVFDTMEEDGFEKSGRKERRLAFMPFPKADASRIGNKNCTVSRKNAMCFVNGNITDENIKKCALDFFRFCHTDQALKIFNESTGGIRPFDFEYTQEEYDSVSYFSQSTYDFNKVADIVYPISYNDLYYNNQSIFSESYYGLYSNINGVGNKTAHMMGTLKNYPSVSAASYFEGISSYYNKAMWDTAFGKYYK